MISGSFRVASQQIEFGTSVQAVLSHPEPAPKLGHKAGRSVPLIAQIGPKSTEQFIREIGGLLPIALHGRNTL